MFYKIIFTDLDSTFLSSKCTVSDENRKALKELYEMGVLVVPVTGRSFDAIPKEISESEYIRYVISSNGSSIKDKQSGKTSCVFMGRELVNKLKSLFKRYTCFPIVHHAGKVIIDKERYDNREGFHFSNYNEAYFKNLTTAVDSFEKWLDGVSDEIEMMLAYFENDNEKAAFLAELKDVEDLHITSSSVTNTEILSKAATKGEGIKRFARMLGVSLDEVIAIGDSDNDVTMLKEAGLGLAVSNGSATAKAAADRVICSNNESSMYYVFENIIKENTKR